MSDLQVKVNDGKYTVIIYDNGRLEARRHGESRRWLTGDNLVFCLATELYEARERINRLEVKVEDLEREIMGDNW